MKKVYALLTMILFTMLSGFSQPVPLVTPPKWDPLAPGSNIALTQFTDPLPHFAAGLRVKPTTGSLIVKGVTAQQTTLPTGTILPNGTVGTNGFGQGRYMVYSISGDGGTTWGPAMWPSQTIEVTRGQQLVVEYRNELNGLTYQDFNVNADQTLMMNGFPMTGNRLIDPYTGPIPMVTHLHGGEMPSNSDGGPMSWFMPSGYGGPNAQGPGFIHDASNVCTYPNQQEGTTLFYHPHDQGLTRINLYLGMAGFYFIRDPQQDKLHLPGWSGDDLVQEVTPAGKSPTFNTAAYLPEVELAIQDRMFDENGGLYWPADAPTNPDISPFWIPEFYGDVMCVNGKAWPYMSVAPRKYAFRALNGCNARWLNLWLSSNPATGVMDGPPITVLSSEGGLLDAPVTIPTGQALLLSPAERPIIIIDFTGFAPGTTFTLMNNANYPYPFGGPVTPGLDDRIMQFVVNGTMVSTKKATVGSDKSVIPLALRPTPMIKLTNFAGAINVPPANITKTRQLILNEVFGPGGPLSVLVNNSRVDDATAFQDPLAPVQFGGPTEIPAEGTTEVWQIINASADAHPMHPHLIQWQLVSRQDFDVAGYMAAYEAAWAANGTPPWPIPGGMTYPGGAGSPNPYDVPNADGAVGGNPAVSPFLLGVPLPPRPEEMGWKDAVTALPGTVETYVCRFAPTDKPLNSTPDQLSFPFDPSAGPGYVWHCHIVDHEDMEMMRPLLVTPNPARATPPSILCPTSAARTADTRKTYYTVKSTEFDLLSVLPLGMTYTYSYAISNPAINGGLPVTGAGMTLKNIQLNVGTNDITWTVANGAGATATCTFTVTVGPPKKSASLDTPVDIQNDIVKCEVTVPNGFSPDGDGINDYFSIGCLQDYPDAKLMIYTGSNREVYSKSHYGNLDFWGNEDEALWDGKANIRNTNVLPAGTYIYILDLENGKKDMVKMGTVFIKR